METRKLINITLTDHQKERLEKVLFELSDQRKRIVLTGSAGVGKTTLVNFLLDEFMKSPQNRGYVYISAPTHKALSVLKTKIAMEEDKDPVVFCTVHAGLKLKPQIDKRTGVKRFVQSFRKSDPPFARCSLLVIDEASMLNDYQLGLLEQYNFPVIFIGDEKQVNPVKEVHSPVFHQNWFTIELTEIIRQAEGNSIIDLSRNLPLIQSKKEDVVGEADQRRGYLYSNDRQKIIYKLAEENGTDNLKYLAWTNAEVDSINFSVRATIYGTPALIERGETLVLNAPYIISEDDILHNNQEIKVETLETTIRNFYCAQEAFEYEVYVVNGNIYAIHENFIGLHHNNVRKLKAMAISRAIDWRQYYEFSEQFLSYKYNHAITVHKSQGSTYKDVVINIKDVMRNRVLEERNRLLYTAVTRASNLVILYNV